MSMPNVLAALLLCGLMGLVGQGIRAAVGLKSAATLSAGLPTQQAQFNAAYFGLSLMIGFIAGVLAGIGLGLIGGTVAVNAVDIKTLLGVAAAGYAGTDFIENTFTHLIPGLGTPTQQTDSGSGSTRLSSNIRTLDATISTLNDRLAKPEIARTIDVTSTIAAPAHADPAAPATAAEVHETADVNTAKVMSNLGAAFDAAASNVVETPSLVQVGNFTRMALDISIAQNFLHTCETSNPRVTYGLGAKVPFLGAIPGKKFTKVDCSGFVREAIRLATNPTVPFPDGSVNQHDWVRAKGFEPTNVADGLAKDNTVRIAFLQPQDVPSGIGHVVLLYNGVTLESHGGVGPDSRTWTGTDWQSKTHVYVLKR